MLFGMTPSLTLSNDMKALLPLRHADAWGSGEYLASRGDRVHRGVDFVAVPGTFIYSDVVGTVTKIGYPYEDNMFYRYVQVLDTEGNQVRYFYLEPAVNVGDEVTPDTILGAAQDLNPRYEGITNHVHLEIKKDGGYRDPMAYLLKLALY